MSYNWWLWAILFATMWHANYRRRIIHFYYGVVKGACIVIQYFGVCLVMIYIPMCSPICPYADWIETYAGADGKILKDHHLERVTITAPIHFVKYMQRIWQLGDYATTRNKPISVLWRDLLFGVTDAIRHARKSSMQNTTNITLYVINVRSH